MQGKNPSQAGGSGARPAQQAQARRAQPAQSAELDGGLAYGAAPPWAYHETASAYAALPPPPAGCAAAPLVPAAPEAPDSPPQAAAPARQASSDSAQNFAQRNCQRLGGESVLALLRGGAPAPPLQRGWLPARGGWSKSLVLKLQTP